MQRGKPHEYTSIAKITRPRVGDIFQRKRLFSLLDRCRERPMTWISAPAGSGKTTLVASYLDAGNLSCIWYQVDEGDADIASFFYYLALAAKKAAPRLKQPLPFLTPEYLQGIHVFTRRYFEDFYQRLQPPFVVVFDNYQDVPADSALHEVIREGLSVIPEDIGVMVLSRTEPPPALARLRVSTAMQCIGWDAIKFSLEEAEAIVTAKERKPVPPDILRHIHAKTEGWAAGLILFLEKLREDEINVQTLDRLASDEIFDYFASEIFEKTDAVTRDFLLKTAFLPKMTVRMAESLTGVGRAGEILSRLNRHHYFTERIFVVEPMYQYHALFRQFLLSKAKSSWSAEEIVEIQRSSAAVLAESGQAEEALLLLREARDWNGFIPLVLSHAQSLTAQGRSKTLVEWLVSIPEQMRDHVPWILYWLGVCRQPFSPSESRALFDRAFHAFQTQGDAAGTLMAWSGAVNATLLEGNDYKSLDRWIGWLDERIRRNMSFPSPEIEMHVASSMASALIWRQPRHLRIREWMSRALALSRRSPDVNIYLQTCFFVSTYYLWMGDLASCSLMVKELENMAQSSTASPVMIIAVKAMATFSHNWSTASYDLSLRLITESLGIARESGVHIWDYFLLSQGVYSSLGKGDVTLAQEFLRKLEMELVGASRFVSSVFHLTAALYHLFLGNISNAAAHAEKTLMLAQEGGTYPTEILGHLATARGKLESGELEKAERHLAAAKKLALPRGGSNFEFLPLMVEAELAFAHGKEAEGTDILRRALSLGKTQKHLNILWWWWQPASLARLCAKALEAGIEIVYVQDIICRRGLVPDAAAATSEHWPWPLKVHTLGRFGIFHDGRPRRFTGKVQKKPLEMLKALIAFGGSDVSEDQIADALWPDAAGDEARASFKTTLHRLRQIIGREDALLLQEGRLSLGLQSCWVDVWAFEKVIDDTGKQGIGEPEKRNLLEKAIQTYRGHFLADEEEKPWAVSPRERLRSKFLRAVTALGASHERSVKFVRAAECYEKALSVDDLAEEFYRKLMECHLKLGSPAEAVKVYRRCKKTLAAALGVNPSSMTEAVYKKALSL